MKLYHLAAGIVLAGLTLTGCSDDKPAAGTQPTAQTSTAAGQQSEPAEKPVGGGSADGFCKAIENGGDVDLRKWAEPSSDPKLREQLTKRLNALAAAAPDEVRPAMQEVANAYELIQTGKVSEDDQATIAKYTAAIQQLNAWMQKHCDLKVPTPAPVTQTKASSTASSTARANGPLPKECSPQSVPALCVTFNLTGDTTVNGSNWVYAEVPDPDLPDSTCAEYGASTLEAEEPGLPKVVKVIGSESVEADFKADQPGDGAGVTDVAASGYVRVDDATYEAEDGGAKLDLQRDGSGRLTVPRLSSGSGSLAGSISWRCIDPR